jgi:hypothetical protein
MTLVFPLPKLSVGIGLPYVLAPVAKQTLLHVFAYFRALYFILLESRQFRRDLSVDLDSYLYPIIFGILC